MRNKWRIFCASVLAAAALIGVSAFLSADRREVWGHTDGLTDEEILQQLEELETKDFKLDVEKALAEGENSEISRLWIHTLFQRVDEYTDDEIIENFLASPKGSLIPYIWMELYESRYPDMDHNDPRLLAWLQDPQNSSGVKASLLYTIGFQTEEEISVLQELTKDADEGLRLNAMRRLELAKPAGALDEAWQIVENYQNGGDNRIHGAIDTIAQQLADSATARNSHWQREKEKLMAVCQQILEQEPSQTLKDAVVYDMQLLGDWDALQMIVDSPDVDQIMKKAIIDNNYFLLEEALLAPEPQAEDIRFAVDCMKILPIQDLHDPLKAALAAQPQAFSADEAEDLPALLDSMLEEGVEAKTWLKEDR